ncbi:MAG: papain-like cysteine protease family protein [Rhizomicrobium sp.]
MPNASLPAFAGPYDLLAPPADPDVLDVPLQPQSQPNWCWAAVAASIVTYAAGRPPPKGHGTPTDQVTLANGYGGLDACGDLYTALDQYKCLASGPMAPPQFHDIADQIGDGNPVCARIATAEGHFVIISGCGSNPEEEVYISDPAQAFGGWHSYAAITSAAVNCLDQIYFTK